MRNNKRMKVTGVILAVVTSMLMSIPTFAYDYKFETKSSDELVQVGRTEVAYDGQIPDYLLNIYDFAPQPIYTSEYGAVIAEPKVPSDNYTTYAPINAPNSNAYVQSANGLINGTTQNGNIYVGEGVSNRIPNYSYKDVE